MALTFKDKHGLADSWSSCHAVSPAPELLDLLQTKLFTVVLCHHVQSKTLHAAFAAPNIDAVHVAPETCP